jgi:uncharacterized protein YfaS (alpha-2-macroglobulin family)
MRHRLTIVLVVLAAVGLYALAFSAETAYGALKGRVIAADTGQPMVGISVMARPVQPKSGLDVQNEQTGKDGVFSFSRLAAGAYQVQTTTQVYEGKPQSVTVDEGQAARADFKLQPGKPFLDLNVHQHACLPEDNPRIALHGFRQGDAVQLALYSVNGATLARDYGGSLRSLLTPVSTSNPKLTAKVLRERKAQQVRAWSHPIRKRDAEGVFYNDERLGHLYPGIYLLEARGTSGRMAASAVGWLVVTDLALVTKSAAGQTLAFTTDLRTGQPVPGAQVSIFPKGTSGGRPAHAVTDARGLAQFRSGGTGEGVEMVALRGDSVAVSQTWGGDNTAHDQYRVHTYTDRPVYRPGHLVRFKGIVRHPEGVGYSVPSPRSLEVEVTDPQDTMLYQESLALNERGSFAGQLDLPAAAASGHYALTVKIDGQTYSSGFAVAAYRKPEWQVEVKAAQSHYVRGERVPVSVHAEYYYGAPVVEAKVHYTVFRSRYWAWHDEDDPELDAGEGEEGDYSDSSGEVVSEGDATTSQGGDARFDFETTLEPNDDHDAQYRYNVQAEVSDASARSVTGNGSVVVSPGALALSAHPSRYVAAPGETVPVIIRALDLQEKPAAGLSVSAAVVLQEWNGKQSLDRPLSTQTVQTDARGRAEVPVALPKTGLVMVRVTATDPRGNKVVTSTDIWCSTSEGGDYLTRYPEIAVIPDKKRYAIGDTAQVLVNASKPGATAIVAIEAERLMTYQLVPLKGRSTVVRFPIRAGYEPNVFVTACFVKGGAFASSQARLTVNDESHRLQVTVGADREVYRPGDTATFHVHTADSRGRAVAAEVSFGLVDEAVYAIQADDAKALWNAFYPRRQNEVSTQFSYPEIYLGDAAKDGAGVTLRKNFPDTAYWSPFLTTDEAGQATVQVKLPDSLTSWRATVRAHTPQTGLGEGTHNVRVMKDLTLRLQTPRSLTEGDHLALSAVAHNYTAGPLDATLFLRVQGLTLQGDARRTVHVESGQAQSVTWEALADKTGTATVSATATAGVLSDGMQLTVPVRPFARREVFYHTGAVSNDAGQEAFTVESGAIDGQAELRLSSTLAGTLLGSLDYLITYPYGCTEQTMSSFLPDVVVTQHLKSLGIHRPELEAKLPAMTQAGLLRLYGFQRPEGGWGWWEYDKPDPWMTAYVVFGLGVAREAGLKVNEQVYQNGLRAAAELADDPKLSPDDAAFFAYVLARAKNMEKARALLKRFGTSGVYRRSLGYRALALASTGVPEDREKAAAVIDYLWGVADDSGGLVHWTEGRLSDRYGAPQDVESTAVILKAALAVHPNDPRLAGVVRWLLLQRRGGHWVSTRDTAWILYALVDYLKATGELKPDYTLTVLLNGREIHSETVRPGDALRDDTVVRIPLAQLAPSNRLEVRKAGAGTAYYALEVTQDVRTPGFTPETSKPGLTVTREYYRLETRRDGYGRPVIAPEKRPVTSVKVGDRLLVRLKLHTDIPMEYLLLEDPLPSSFEVQERGDVDRDEWDHWWCHMDVRDDRVALFIRELTPGDHVVEYYVRPEMAGTVRALPAVLSDMYVPSTRAATGEARLEIGR